MLKRKKKLEPITKPDVTNTDPAYWEMVLESYGLGLGRGRNPQQVYVGGSNEVERLEEWIFRTQTGVVRPPGYPPDRDA